MAGYLHHVRECFQGFLEIRILDAAPAAHDNEVQFRTSLHKGEKDVGAFQRAGIDHQDLSFAKVVSVSRKFFRTLFQVVPRVMEYKFCLEISVNFGVVLDCL